MISYLSFPFSFRPIVASFNRSTQGLLSNIKPVKTTLFGLSCGYAVHQWKAHKSVQVRAEGDTPESKTHSSIPKEEWKLVAKEINIMGQNMKQALAWEWYDYLIFYGITAFTLGVAALFLPLWKYHFYKKHVSDLKIGHLRCRLKGDYWDFLFEVFLYSFALNTLTFGIYSLLGFSSRLESHWLDNNVEWFVDSEDFEKI
ncbi:hypothetical protein RFI_28864 [Reticulomyxa filosa]|uniref:Uncharacterized protein n=1 Tax=Reticulomyxa filosa TaxID=46433 RepID=X6M3M2_RETFI|nr:hypothetical protein RFI_28864 [Reticulomyxa filosa]|eukprot:ETO08524.1 hypothetical protein RFI_28864 [Reticulomyxa filosa]